MTRQNYQTTVGKRSLTHPHSKRVSAAPAILLYGLWADKFPARMGRDLTMDWFVDQSLLIQPCALHEYRPVSVMHTVHRLIPDLCTPGDFTFVRTLVSLTKLYNAMEYGHV